MRLLQETATKVTSGSPVNHHGVTPQSPWHSPVPYLFGGLAAILGLIAFALLILACSYWRFSSSDEENDQNDEEKESKPSDKSANGAYKEKFLVIMAGDDLPRFLATPAMKKCTCGGGGGGSGGGGQEGKMVITHDETVAADDEEKVKDTGETTTTSY